MSNYLAIATVTAVLRYILGNVSKEPRIGNVRITTTLPHLIGTNQNDDGLNIYLYKVAPNLGYNNFDLPTRNFNGDLVKRPLLALNLQYLLTGYTGDNDDIHVQQLLASGMRILNEHSVLTRTTINSAMQALIAVNPDDNIGKNSDLIDQVEIIKVTLLPMSLEEITKLWSSFFQTNYRISVSYQATVVLLDNPQLKHKSTFPVIKRRIHSVTLRRPIIDKVEPQILEQITNAKLTITGRNLKSENVIVMLGDTAFTSSSEITELTDDKIVVTVPDTLSAGIKAAKVIHSIGLRGGEDEEEQKPSPPSPPTPIKPIELRRVFESNVVAFVHAPRITEIRINGIVEDPPTITHGVDILSLKFKPSLYPEQKVEIVVGDSVISLSPTFPVSDNNEMPIDEIRDIDTTNFPFGPSDQPDKNHFLLRLRIDGAESLLQRDENPNSETYNKFIGPFNIEVT